MQRLNIPFSRHTKTTRPLRQVVWLLGFFALVLVFVTWRAGEMWFSRDSILRAAPEGTILAVQLELTDASWPTIQNIFATIPLISNRSLDINDLSPFIQGELALFVTQTGERAIAIRTDQQNLPTELLTALSITTQEITPSIVLMSQTLLPVSGIDSKAQRPLFVSLSRRWFGRIELPDISLSGSLYEKEGDIEIQFTNQGKKGYSKMILPQIMLAMSSNTSGVTVNHDQELGTFSSFLNQEWTVFVEANDSGDTDLLLMTRKGNLQESDILSLLQLMGAYLSPSIQESTLVDGSVLREVMVEPEIVTVEEIQLGQIQALHVLGVSGRSIYGAFIDDQVIFTTNEKMLKAVYQPGDSDSDCIGNVLRLDPSAMLGSTRTVSYNRTIQALQSISSHFSAISFEMKKYSSSMKFCST
ncbi:MAG: hypothetical protein WC654_01355 [Patescibacteria group bacterium]